jgi:hypothetical protein
MVDRHDSRAALRFIILIGILSFFADFTYEGSRSIVGPYLASLQASGAIVGIVTAFGELLATDSRENNCGCGKEGGSQFRTSARKRIARRRARSSPK